MSGTPRRGLVPRARAARPGVARAVRALGAAVVTGALAACFAFGTIRGYSASGAGARYTGDVPPGCEEAWAVPPPAGATLVAVASVGSVHPTSGEQLMLDVHLLVPEGVTVQLDEAELELESPAWSGVRALAIVAVEDWSGAGPDRVRAPRDLVRGTASTGSYPGFGLSLVAEGPRARTGLDAVGAFELRLPALSVNGVPVAPGPIRFAAWERRGISVPPD